MGSGASPRGLGQLLDAFDGAWAAYLQRFVAWKFADAAALESELIKVAIEMEASVLSKTRGDTSPHKQRSEDLQVSFLSCLPSLFHRTLCILTAGATAEPLHCHCYEYLDTRGTNTWSTKGIC